MLTSSDRRLLHALKSRSGREKNDAFTVEGIRAVEELAASAIDLKFAIVSPSLEDTARGHALVEVLAKKTGVKRVTEAELRSLTDTETPQGVVVVARIPQRDLTSVQLRDGAPVLVLDAVQDPGNLGTLIRSADAFAANCVIALPGTVDYWNPKVVRAAAGSAFRVPLISASPDKVWRWLSDNQFAVCGADARGSNVTEMNGATRVALVVGNEGSGLSDETRSHVAQMIAVPMPGHAESLNVAVATGILLYELSRTN